MLNTIPARAARPTPDTNTRARIDALNQEAEELRRTDIARMMRLYEQAHALSSDQDAPYLAGQGASLLGLAFGSASSGQLELALTRSLEAHSCYEQIGDMDGQSKALSQIGTVYYWLGEYVLALDAQLQSLEIAQRAGNRQRQIFPLLQLGIVNSEMGRHREALPYYEQALALCQELGDTYNQARILNSYCVDLTSLGEYDQALDYGQRSLERFESLGQPYGQGVALGSIGEALIAAGQYGRAIEALQRSLALMQIRGDSVLSHEAVSVSYHIGLAHLRRGDLADALEALQRALAAAEQRQFKFMQYQCHEQLATLYEQSGDPAQALQHFRQFHTIREQVFNEESDKKLNNLQVIHRTREAIAEAERQRQMREDDRRYFEQLSLLQKEFFNAATHDLRNPLLAIGLGIDVLELRAAPDDTDTHELLSSMRHGVRRMSQLIADILDLAKLETGRSLRAETLSATPLLMAVVRDHQLAAEQKGIHLELITVGSDAAISADAAQLRRALDNLIDNAIKYTPPSGRVTIHTAVAGDLLIQVTDTGSGISADDLPHLFEHFYRAPQAGGAAAEGTGLGLAIAKKIIEQHRGSVWAESEMGRGSTFSVRLPLVSAPHTP
jgi:signal transduction histidine kinase